MTLGLVSRRNKRTKRELLECFEQQQKTLAKFPRPDVLGCSEHKTGSCGGLCQLSCSSYQSQIKYQTGEINSATQTLNA